VANNIEDSLVKFGLDEVDAETKKKIAALIAGVPKRRKTGIRDYADSYGTDDIKSKFELILAAILKLYPEAINSSTRIVDEFKELNYPDVELFKLISSLVDWKTKGDSLALVVSQLTDVSVVEDVEDVVDDLLDIE
jgi:hypothetical protein